MPAFLGGYLDFSAALDMIAPGTDSGPGRVEELWRHPAARRVARSLRRVVGADANEASRGVHPRRRM